IPLDPSSPSSSQPRPILHLARRDLFDARFQILHDDDDDENDDDGDEQPPHPTADEKTNNNNNTLTRTLHNLKLRDDPATEAAAVGADSDLVPGVYEGGLKTWECAADLIAELHARTSDGRLEFGGGKKVIELGCGTALPSMYVLSQLLSQESPPSAESTIELHLADFNPQVLRLVTLPNLILTWFFSSPAALPFHHEQPTPSDHPTQEAPKSTTTPNKSPEHPGDLELSPALLSAFQEDLAARKIRLRFFSGPWSSLADVLFPPPSSDDADGDGDERRREYDVVLSSETVYSLSTLPSLVDILHVCCTASASASAQHQHQHQHQHQQRAQGEVAQASPPQKTDTLCLVAAKVLYFGVGGGVHSFINAVQSSRKASGGYAHVVRELNVGVGRAVLQTGWSSTSSA
ncbi:unnamed protein product, partial [Tilletia laevis]